CYQILLNVPFLLSKKMFLYYWVLYLTHVAHIRTPATSDNGNVDKKTSLSDLKMQGTTASQFILDPPKLCHKKTYHSLWVAKKICTHETIFATPNLPSPFSLSCDSTV